MNRDCVITQSDARPRPPRHPSRVLTGAHESPSRWIGKYLAAESTSAACKLLSRANGYGPSSPRSRCGT